MGKKSEIRNTPTVVHRRPPFHLVASVPYMCVQDYLHTLRTRITGLPFFFVRLKEKKNTKFYQIPARALTEIQWSCDALPVLRAGERPQRQAQSPINLFEFFPAYKVPHHAPLVTRSATSGGWRVEPRLLRLGSYRTEVVSRAMVPAFNTACFFFFTFHCWDSRARRNFSA